jgi:hypothetical protein
LVAQEITEGKVHPEFPKILSRLSANDAQLLAQIAEQEKYKSITLKRALKRFTASVSVFGASIDLLGAEDSASFAHEHLASLHLIRSSQGNTSLTLTGKAFIESVSDAWGGESAA